MDTCPHNGPLCRIFFERGCVFKKMDLKMETILNSVHTDLTDFENQFSRKQRADEKGYSIMSYYISTLIYYIHLQLQHLLINSVDFQSGARVFKIDYLENKAPYETISFSIFNLLLHEEPPPFWFHHDFGNTFYIEVGRKARTSVAGVELSYSTLITCLRKMNRLNPFSTMILIISLFHTCVVYISTACRKTIDKSRRATNGVKGRARVSDKRCLYI